MIIYDKIDDIYRNKYNLKNLQDEKRKSKKRKN